MITPLIKKSLVRKSPVVPGLLVKGGSSGGWSGKPADWSDIRKDCPDNSIALYAAHSSIYTKVGNPTIENGMVSGFSSSDYVSISNKLDFTNNNECIIKFTTPSVWDKGSNQYLFTSNLFLYFTANGTLRFGYKGTDSTWPDYNIQSTLDVSKQYWIKFSNTSNTLNVYFSEDGITYSLKQTKDISNIDNSYKNDIRFGILSGSDYFNGSIDLNETYIKVNDEYLTNNSQYDNLGFTATCTGGYKVFIDGNQYPSKNLITNDIDGQGTYISPSASTTTRIYKSLANIPLGTYTLTITGDFEFIMQKKIGSAGENIGSWSTTGTYTFDDATATYGIAIRKADNLSITPDDFNGTLQLEKGSTATTYEPFGLFASGAQCSITWSTSGIATGDIVTTPSLLKAHKIWIEPATEGNNITAFRCARVANSGTEEQGVLWAHFNISNAISLEALFNGNSDEYNNKQLMSVTAKNDNILVNSNLFKTFANCINLEYLAKLIGDNVSDYNLAQAFYKCEKLKQISLVKMIIAFAHYAFFDCFLLSKINTSDVIVNPKYSLSYTYYRCHNLQKVIQTTYNSSVQDLSGYLTEDNKLKDTVLDISGATNLNKVEVLGTSLTYFMTGLKGLRVSNSAPFMGSAPQIDVSYTGMDRQAIVTLFNDLPTVTSGQIINITGCTGAMDIIGEELQIATDKGWTVVGGPSFTTYYRYTNANNQSVYSLNALSGNSNNYLEENPPSLSEIIGSLTINDDVYSNFSDSNYIKLNNIPALCELVFKITLGSNVSARQMVASTTNLIELDIDGGYLKTYNFQAGGDLLNICSVQSNETYWVKIIVKENTKEYYYSTNGTDYTLGLTAQDNSHAQATMYIGKHASVNGYVYLGSIDAANSYIKHNDSIFYFNNLKSITPVLLHLDGNTNNSGDITLSLIGGFNYDTTIKKFGTSSGKVSGYCNLTGFVASTTDKYTFEYWLYIESTTQDYLSGYFAWTKGSGAEIIVNTGIDSTDGGRFFINLSQENVFSKTLSNAFDTWHHIAVVYNGDSTFSFFLDGQKLNYTLTADGAVSGYNTIISGTDTNKVYYDEIAFHNYEKYTSDFVPQTEAYSFVSESTLNPTIYNQQLNEIAYDNISWANDIVTVDDIAYNNNGTVLM